MFGRPTCFLEAKLEGRIHPDGSRGVYARDYIEQGERLAVWGGEVMNWEQLMEVPPESRRYSIQIEEDLFLVSEHVGPGDWVNHSCNPNAGIQGQVVLVALRDIAPGEQVCFDYAMSDSVPYDEFDCACGALECRGKVSADDWRNPILQNRYQGYFSAYLARRIEQEQNVTLSAGAIVSTNSSLPLPLELGSA